MGELRREGKDRKARRDEGISKRRRKRGRKGMYEKQTKIKREREMEKLRKKGCMRWKDREQYSRGPTERGMNEGEREEKEKED